jgi:hypothetical protein
LRPSHYLEGAIRDELALDVRNATALPGSSWLGRSRGLRYRLGGATRGPNGGGARCGEGSRLRGMTCGITRRTRRRCIRRFPSKSNTPDNLSRGPAREAYCPSPACTQTEQEGRIERVWRIALNVEFASPSARSSDSWPAHIRRPRRCADPRSLRGALLRQVAVLRQVVKLSQRTPRTRWSPPAVR